MAIGLESTGSTPLQCTGADSVTREFYYEIESDREAGGLEIIVRVYEQSQISIERHWFDFILKPLDENRLMVSMMQHNNKEWYRAKGIPDALIPALAQRFQKVVTSSSNCDAAKKFPEESRNGPASKVWKRLVEQGRATYQESVDRYVCAPPSEMKPPKSYA